MVEFVAHVSREPMACYANSSMGLVRLTKFEVAEKQLAKAIELFCAQEPLPAITLAGAAEEILGKLVKDAGGVNALEEEVKDRCDLYQTVTTATQRFLLV